MDELTKLEPRPLLGTVVTDSRWRALWLRYVRGYTTTRVSYVPEAGAFGSIRYRKKQTLERLP